MYTVTLPLRLYPGDPDALLVAHMGAGGDRESKALTSGA
jgi:hypothetical protein